MVPPLQTFQRSYTEILAGEDPWISLGKMMHQFFGAYKMYRAELVRDPILVPTPHSSEQLRWAAFCAASVEYLCKKYTISCPDWVYKPAYALAEPWYYAIGADLLEVKEELRRTTPKDAAWLWFT